MGENRQINIQQNAVERIAEMSWYFEKTFSEALAKKFVDEVFATFDKLAKSEVLYHKCNYQPWNELGYRCYPFRKKYIIAYLDLPDEIIITDFSLSSLLK